MRTGIKTLVVLATMLSISCGGSNTPMDNSSDKDSAEAMHSWSQEKLNVFSKQCVTVAREFAGNKAEEYCNCVMDLVTSAHPDPDAVHDLEEHQWVSLLENSECHENFNIPILENQWTDEVSSSFLTGCMESAIERYKDEVAAQRFCDCALEKTKAIIPSPNFAIMLSEDEYNTIYTACE